MKKTVIFATLIAASLSLVPAVFAENQVTIPMAKLCGACHDPQPGVMMGFLENIALKSKTIQMDFTSHKEIIKFTDDTSLKYVKDFSDIGNYKNKGFQINFVEKNGVKIAEEIIRFDIMKVEALSDDDFIDKQVFKKFRKNQNVRVYDVRPPMKYKMAHIPGAMMMPAPEFDTFKKNLPEDHATPIIFYGVGGCLSPTTALGTKALGYSDVKIFAGGFPDWSLTDFAMVTPEWLKMAISQGIPHVLIDVRPEEVVIDGHIPGAVNITVADLDKYQSRFPGKKNAPIIIYGLESKEAADIIVSWGYKAVRILPLSFEGWKAMDNQIAEGPAGREIKYVSKPKTGTISIDDFKKAARGELSDVILVDVRNSDEFFTNRLPNTVNMPVDVISERAELMGSTKELILFCNTGVRAEMAHNILNKDGVKNRYLDATVTISDGELEVEEN